MVNSIKQNQQNSTQLTEQEMLNIKRMRTPSSARLQDNILNLTQELPQYTNQLVGAEVHDMSSFLDKVGVLKKVNFWSGFKPYAATIAAGFVVIALSSTLWMPTQNDQLTVDGFEALSVERLADEIEWQDLMLLQDELAFAGL